MPSESSVYRKIQVVLDIAKSVKVKTTGDLRNEVEGLKPSNFLTRQFDKNRDSFVTDVSDQSVRRIVSFCHLLHLIRDDGSLTEEGRQALRKTQFDKVVAVQVRTFLQREGISLSKINEMISKDLHSNPPVLPTCKELWVTIGNNTKYSVFSRMLTLLAQCGGAKSSQKKIYLHVNQR
jgi:hypothetical protein